MLWCMTRPWLRLPRSALRVCSSRFGEVTSGCRCEIKGAYFGSTDVDLGRTSQAEQHVLKKVGPLERQEAGQ